jgi:hypothetical protein
MQVRSWATTNIILIITLTFPLRQVASYQQQFPCRVILMATNKTNNFSFLYCASVHKKVIAQGLKMMCVCVWVGVNFVQPKHEFEHFLLAIMQIIQGHGNEDD